MAEKQIAHENIATNILHKNTRVKLFFFANLFSWCWSEHKQEMAIERNSHKNLKFMDRGIWGGILLAHSATV